MRGRLLLLAACALVAACTSVGVGVTIPVGGIGRVGVGVDSAGQVGGTVGVSMGGVGVNVGGSGRLPAAPQAAASAASSAR